MTAIGTNRYARHFFANLPRLPETSHRAATRASSTRPCVPLRIGDDIRLKPLGPPTAEGPDDPIGERYEAGNTLTGSLEFRESHRAIAANPLLSPVTLHWLRHNICCLVLALDQITRNRIDRWVIPDEA